MTGFFFFKELMCNEMLTFIFAFLRVPKCAWLGQGHAGCPVMTHMELSLGLSLVLVTECILFPFYLCVCVCIWAGLRWDRVGCGEWRGWFSRRLEEYVQSARVGIKGSCKPPDTGAGN